MRKFCGKTSLWRMLVEFLCPEAAQMLELSHGLTLGVYALTVHVRMFNAAPETHAIEALGSFQKWCTSGGRLSEAWRAQGRSPAVVGHPSRGRPYRIPMWQQQDAHAETATIHDSKEVASVSPVALKTSVASSAQVSKDHEEVGEGLDDEGR